MPSTITPVQSPSQQIARLAVIADSIGNLLGAHHLLLPAGQVDAIAVSASMAAELVEALAELNGGAA